MQLNICMCVLMLETSPCCLAFRVQEVSCRQQEFSLAGKLYELQLQPSRQQWHGCYRGNQPLSDWILACSTEGIPCLVL